MRFFKKPLIRAAEKFLATKFWKSLMRVNLRFWGYPRLPLEKYFHIRDIIRNNPKDIFCFVGVDNASVATWFQRKIIGYYWGHSGFVELDAEGEISISHVRYYGLLRWKLLKYMKECDEFALLRLPLGHLEKKKVERRLAKIKKSKVLYKLKDNLSKTKQYKDPEFWKKSDIFYFYCSEYQYFICQGLMNEHFQRGRDRFSPDDLYRGCEVVWEFRAKSSK